jgi:hypothetical protein
MSNLLEVEKDLNSFDKTLKTAGNMFANGYAEKSDKLIKRNYKKRNYQLGYNDNLPDKYKEQLKIFFINSKQNTSIFQKY